MKYNRYPKRDAIKNCFLLPNELFTLGLESTEISIYAYLLRLENRETYQCWPSYKTIGRAVNVSENTVRKYVAGLEDKRLITTEPTMIRTKDGLPRNGSLLYTIRPIQEAIDCYHERQMARFEAEAARQRAARKLEEYDRKYPQKPLCAALDDAAGACPAEGKSSGFEPLSEDAWRTTGFPPKPSEAGSVGEGGAA